jgi:TolA-binding protein
VRSWLVRAAREWPWGIASVAILSLLFVPRVVRFGSFVSAAQQQEFDALDREVREGDPAAAEAGLVSFLVRYPRSPLKADANLLLARATVARGRSGSFPGAAGLARAWSILKKAPRTAEYLGLRRETADQMEEYGLVREAYDSLKLLHTESHDPDIGLDLARVLARRAALEPKISSDWLDEASTLISEAIRVGGEDRRIQARLVQARVFRQEKRDEDLAADLAAELKEIKAPAARGLLQLERGRTFARLGRNMEAMAAFDEAERLIADPLLRGMAQVHQAELFIRAENPEGIEICKRVQASESPATPFALIVLGVSELKAHPAAGLDLLRNGFSHIGRPRVLDDAGFETAWVQSAVRAATERESDPDRLLKAAGVFAELVRLQPLSAQVGFEHAALLLRARRYEEAADRFLAAGNSERAEPETRERALLSAADACNEGKLYRRAAAHYQEFADLRPAANTAGLFHRAASLRKAGDLAAAKAACEDYVIRAGPTGTFAGAALVEKASLQEAAGEDADALATLDRVLKAREVSTSPEKDDWAQALLARGRTLLRLGRPAEARKSLEEYLERYAEGAAPAPASLEAAWQLVRVAVEERQWKTGLERLRLLDALAGRLTEADRAPYDDRLKEARFVEGDLLFELGDFAAASRVYGEASRRASDADDRLRGLIGRARALARLERLEEARRDYTTAKALLDEGRGRTQDYWTVALQSLAREVR